MYRAAGLIAGDDDQDGAGDGDLGFGASATVGDPPVAFAEEGGVRNAAPVAAWPRWPRSQLSPWFFLAVRVRGPDWLPGA